MGRPYLAFLLTALIFLAASIAAVATTAGLERDVVEHRIAGFGAERVDRCATCHVVEEGAELPARHPDVPGRHPIERFGCVLCHGGEGRALDQDWAHHGGGEPLFHLGSGEERRVEWIEAGCARCHVELTPAGPVYDAVLVPHVASGRDLFLGRGCWGCHGLADLSFGERGPELSDAGARLTGAAIREAIEDPSAAPSSTTMPNMGLPEGEIVDLTAFLMAQVGADRRAAVATARMLEARRAGTPPRRAEVDEGMAAGGELMLRLGCAGCHRLASRDGRVGPDLRWEGDLRGPRYVRDMIERPAATVTGSRMPPFDLSRSEVDAAVEFLARQRAVPPEDQETAWREVCARCHGLDGRGRTAVAPYLSRRPRDLSDPRFFRGVEPSRITRSLRDGVAGTAMAPWARAIPSMGGRRVVTFLAKTLHGGALPQPRRVEVPRAPERASDEARAAARRVFAVECASCHGPSGRGDGPEAESLRPRPRDLGNAAFIQAQSSRRLFLSIGYGPVGSDMPGHLWGNSPEIVWALVDQVRAIAGEPLTGRYDEDRWPWQRVERRRRDRPRRGGRGRRGARGRGPRSARPQP